MSLQDALSTRDRGAGVIERTVHSVRNRLTERRRLHAVIDKGAKAWLSLDPPVQWEGCLGSAMEAAVEEIKSLRSQLGAQ